MACNLKKVPCKVGALRPSKKRKVHKARSPSCGTSEDLEDPSEAIQGRYNLSLLTPPSYCQQVLDDIVGVGARIRIAHWHLMAIREDQWQLGMQQLELQEIGMKVDFGVLTPEEGAAEMEKLLELVPTELKKILYKSVYERWEARQEKISEEQRKKKGQGRGKEGAGPEEDRGADVE